MNATVSAVPFANDDTTDLILNTVSLSFNLIVYEFRAAILSDLT